MGNMQVTQDVARHRPGQQLGATRKKDIERALRRLGFVEDPHRTNKNAIVLLRTSGEGKPVFLSNHDPHGEIGRDGLRKMLKEALVDEQEFIANL